MTTLGSLRLGFAPVLLALAACARGNESDGFGGGYVASGGSGSSSASDATSTGQSSAQSTGQASSTASVTASASGASASTGAILPGTLFFSEYVEGSGNNKAVEIVNAGPTPTDLSGCFVDRYQNGAVTAGEPPLPLDAVTLPGGGTFVLCNSAFSQLGLCDQTSDYVQHSGDDVVALRCADGLRDVIGRIGESTVWGISPTITQDATLRRKCSVTTGDKNGADAFDPSLEWDGFSADAFGDLGQRICP